MDEINEINNDVKYHFKLAKQSNDIEEINHINENDIIIVWMISIIDEINDIDEMHHINDNDNNNCMNNINR